MLRLAPAFAAPSGAHYVDSAHWGSCDNTSTSNRWRGATAHPYGSAFDDELPFENLPFVDAPAALAHGARYTNRDLWGLLDPSNRHLPYIYDQFTTWGECEWDPLGDDGGGDDDAQPPPDAASAGGGGPDDAAARSASS